MGSRSEKKIYSIGEMARLCGLTTKALRYYDEQGILHPSFINEQTNYRYYDSSQIPSVLMVKELKELDIPLKEIKSILQDKGLNHLHLVLSQRIETELEAVNEAIRRYHRTVSTYLRLDSAIKNIEFNRILPDNKIEISLETFPAQTVVFTRRKSYWNAATFFTDRRAELVNLVDRFELKPTGVVSAVFHGSYMDQFSQEPSKKVGDLELFQPVESSLNCPYCRLIPEFKALTTIHVGHYLQLEQTYRKIEEYAQEKGLSLKSCSVEEYICSVTMTGNANNLVTRVYVPLADESSVLCE